MMDYHLGKWAVIDIETTGLDEGYDQMIDIGFLQFEHTQLVHRYSSLIKSSLPLGQYIQLLTGITPSMLKDAPTWLEVQEQVRALEGHVLLAHNSSFEAKFLEPHFARLHFADSIPLLGLLHPQKGELNLESFIIGMGIKEKEEHRGYADAEDLLKVILLSLHSLHERPPQLQFLRKVLQSQQLLDQWWGKLLFLSVEELQTLAQQLSFSLAEGAEKRALSQLPAMEKVVSSNSGHRYSLEFSGKNIQEILQDETKVQEVLPHYTYRDGQQALALRTGQALIHEKYALIQAPTGTGKTLGYLLPAVLFSKSQGEQVLISTGTKQLQQQALEKDLPQLARLLGLSPQELVVTRLIGSKNHLCQLFFEQQLESDPLLSALRAVEERYARAYLEIFFQYNAQFFTGKNGSPSSIVNSPLYRLDIPLVLKKMFRPLAQLEESVAVDFRACMGHRCPHQGQCTYIQGIKSARDSHLIIGNHALMFAWPKTLPRPTHLIIDEAHRLEKEATEFYSLKVSLEDLQQLQKSCESMQGVGALLYILQQQGGMESEKNGAFTELRSTMLESAQILQEHLSSLPDMLERYFKKAPRYTSLYWNELPMVKRQGAGESSGVSIYNCMESILFVLKNVFTTLAPYWNKNKSGTNADNINENELQAIARFESFMGPLEDTTMAWEQILQGKEGFVAVMKFHEEMGMFWESSPINIGEMVHDDLLQKSRAVIFTSATFGAVPSTTAANLLSQQNALSYEWPSGLLYVAPQRRFRGGLFIDPVFDYANQAQVFLCDDTPGLNDPQFVPFVLSKISPTIAALGGRSLLLFSAKTRFEVAREILLEKFAGKIPLFFQGMGQKVVEEFKKSPMGILVGMESFAEGIDIPGESLQFVFIDKIPDLRQDLVIDARRKFFDKTFGNEFFNYYLAHRALSLQQKLGRLIRTTSDYGVAVVVDGRVRTWKKSTMESFLSLLHPYRVRTTSLPQACLEIDQFFTQKNSGIEAQVSQKVSQQVSPQELQHEIKQEIKLEINREIQQSIF